MPAARESKPASVSERPGRGLIRLDLSTGDPTATSCLAKVTSRREVASHRLVDAALPGLSPRFFQAVPLGDGDPARQHYLLLMEDCGAHAPITTLTALVSGQLRRHVCQTSVKAAIRHLASVHRHFETRIGELEMLGIPPVSIGHAPDAREFARTIDLAIDLSGRDRCSESLVARCAAVSAEMSDFFARLQNKARHTLVHGDFHFDNILVRKADELIIVDWGAAATANPCWDLVFCELGELAAYLHAAYRQARQYRVQFLEDHRAAVAVRMFVLLRAAAALPGRQQTALRPAVDVIVRNLARVTSRPYQGGIGFSNGARMHAPAQEPIAAGV
jgi:Phosphotransferase enzyme family